MKRISQIDICNYRAFYNEENNPEKYKICLPQGENLLIYGENGSGKSSLFKALEDFFISSEEEDILIQENIFTSGKLKLPPSEIKISTSEYNIETNTWSDLEQITFNNDAPTTFDNPLLKDTSKAFLTYRDILKTYFLENDKIELSPNLFKLFLDKLLSKIIDSSTNAYIVDDLDDILRAVETIDDAISEALTLPDGSEHGKTQLETKGKEVIREEILESVKEKISIFNTGVTNILEEAIADVNNYLRDFFKTNIEVSIKNKDEYLSLALDKLPYKLSRNLFLDIKYYKQEIHTQSYHGFLNEARLSALAICIYLAAVKRDNPSEDNLKILFLDDIFIGLDSSNRVPLLEILNKYFTDFQIFITTYDYHWFELAKNWFEHRTNKTWKFFELYSDNYTYSDFELPKLLTSQEPLAQAIYYYKQSDYPASGNYLRRACEKAIRSILPPICLKNGDGLDISELSRLIENAKIFFRVIKEPTMILDNLAVYLQALMNPLSHYDINISIFRKEIKEIEEAITKIMQKDFSNTKFRKILVKNTLVKLTYKVISKTHNVYEIRLKEDLWIFQHQGDKIQLGEVKCKNENLYEIVGESQGQIFHNNIESSSLRTFYENMVNYENEKSTTPKIIIRPDYENLYEFEDAMGIWHKLYDLIHF